MRLDLFLTSDDKHSLAWCVDITSILQALLDKTLHNNPLPDVQVYKNVHYIRLYPYWGK